MRPVESSSYSTISDDPECDTTGPREACHAENIAALKKLKIDPDRDDLSDLLQCAAISARKDTLRYRLNLGANANEKINGGSSALDTSALCTSYFDRSRLLRNASNDPKCRCHNDAEFDARESAGQQLAIRLQIRSLSADGTARGPSKRLEDE